jgi:hypothetical protein
MLVALLASLLLAALAVFQGLLVAGAPLGRFAWGGQHEVLPTGFRIGSVVSIALYAAFAVLILQAAGLIYPLPDDFADVAIWVLTGYFVLGIAMNAISRSRAERRTMTPVVAILAVTSLVLALG